MYKILTTVISIGFLLSCKEASKRNATMDTGTKGSFAFDRSFILKHDTGAIVLYNGEAQVLISPKFQAKVFTSSAEGDSGHSFGWINYKAFGVPLDPHMNAFGGENRLWLGPEGGPFSLFFPKDAKMSFENWKTPSAFDSEAWAVVAKNKDSALLQKHMRLTNYKGTSLELRVERTIKVLSTAAIDSGLHLEIGPLVKTVGYHTENAVTNTGKENWTEKTGMPCIWILDMFPPSGQTTIVIPYKAGEGNPVTTNYFGEIPPDRIRLKGNMVYFKADGKQRRKLGIHPDRVQSYAGSYNAKDKVLTIILFDTNPDGKYLNQEWRTDRPVFSGDAMNAYNDGPLEGGGQLGPFFELESVSPALFLAPGKTVSHNHTVFHFTGPEEALDPITMKIFGLHLSEISESF